MDIVDKYFKEKEEYQEYKLKVKTRIELLLAYITVYQDKTDIEEIKERLEKLLNE